MLKVEIVEFELELKKLNLKWIESQLQ